MHRVFISSTSLDLPEYRQAVVEVCNALGLVPLDMKDWSPRDVGATRGSLEKLDQAHVYVGIFAHRYGYVEPGSDGSVTEAEYDHAEQLGLERLCFLLQDDYPWPPSRIDYDQLHRLRAFKERIRERIVNWFTTVEDFRYKVHKALSEWQQRQGPAALARASAGTGPVPRQLPGAPADFVGRGALLDELRRQIEGGVHFVGVHGLGGVGKTALALKLAERLVERCPDGQIYLDLKGVEPRPLPVRDVMAHVVHAFYPEAVLPREGTELAGRYRTVLSGKRALLLLDNAADEKQVEPLLPPEGALVLVTSRHRFHLPGLTAVDLETLSPAESSDLLRTIAPRLESEEAVLLAQKCGQLPLALRLAGAALARRRDLSPQRYLRQLAEARLQVLTAVAASIRLSEEQLPAPVRTKWRELAVLVGGLETAWAAAVWDVDETTADSFLGELIVESLLDWDEKTQCYRLHDLIRAYAQDGLEPPRRSEAERRHARLFCGLLTRANEHFLKGSSAIVEALRWFDRVWPDAQAGFAWARDRLQADEEAARLCCEYTNASRYVRDLRQHPQASVAWLETAVQAARRLNHRQQEADALGYLGNAYHVLGQPQRAIDFHQQYLAIAREIGDRRREGVALGYLGTAYHSLGELERAIDFFQQRLAIAREVGDRRREGTALGSLGLAYAALGEPERAIAFSQQGLAIVREIGDRRGEAKTLGNLGLAYAALGELQRAIDFYQQDLAIVREIGDRRGEGFALGHLGLAHAALGEWERATDFFQQHLAIAREVGDRRSDAFACWNLGHALVQLNRLAEALPLLEVCVRFEQEIGHHDAQKHAAVVAELRQRLDN